MAQSFAMECPATPERVDQCPATPDFTRRAIKSPENTSSSDESTFQNNNRTATGSPPPNCAICLGKCRNKCFTDSCLHQFCFKCLLEWSKVKAECPLCKQSFKSIIHNVKSDDQFEEYLVQSPPNAFPDFSRPMRAHIQLPSRSSFSATMQLHANTLSNSIIQLRTNISTRFRRYVYDGGLYALPLPDVTGRFRECSARFYRENVSQVHRLMPWLNRELVCLLRDSHNATSTVLCTIHDLLTIFNINSPDFRRRVSPYLGHHTAHFIHEFLNFARSPYDIIGYDREVRYAINSNDEVVINATSSSSDSDDVAEIADENQLYTSESMYNRRQRNNNAGVGLTIEATNDPHSAVSTVHIIIGDGDSNGSNNSNVNTAHISHSASSSQMTAINLSTNNNSSTNPSNEIVNLNNSESVIEINETNHSSHQLNDERISLLSSASSDTCEFVLERKPPHLRTPEMVSLNSDSDSDVVFISEQKRPEENLNSAPTPGTSGVSFNIGRQTRLKSSRMRNISGIFMPSSDVDHSSDSDFKPTVERTRKSRPRKLKPRQSKRVIKDEFNAGPSTSSGITGSGKPMSLLYSSSSSSRSKRQKHNSTKPKNFGNNNRPCSGRGYKAIYESSSSSDSESSRNESDDDDDDDDHKSSSSDENIDNVTKSDQSSNTASNSSNTSSSARSSSSSSTPHSIDRNTKNKFKPSDVNHKSESNSSRNKIAARRSTRSSSSSSTSSSSLPNKENRSRSSSKSTSSSSSTSTNSNTTDNTSNNSNKTHCSSLRKNNVRQKKYFSNKKHKLLNKSTKNKLHSMRHKKKDQDSNKINKDLKKNKLKSKSKKTSNYTSKKKEHKKKKLKDKKRKRKLINKIKSQGTTDFSESDAEPLSKHIKTCKSEIIFSENEFENSTLNNIENEPLFQPHYEPDLQRHQDSTSVLLCFPNDVHMPMNLSTTEQIQNEPPPSPLLTSTIPEAPPLSEEIN